MAQFTKEERRYFLIADLAALASGVFLILALAEKW